MPGQDPEYDQWIDQALDDYAALRDEDTPRRIVAGTMRRVEDWQNRRRRVRLFEFAGALAFACGLVAVLLWTLPGTVPPPPTRIASSRQLEPPEFSYSIPAPKPVGLTKRRSPAALRESVAVTAAPPKQDRFPAPSRLSSEELAMVALASRSHITEQQVLQLQQRPTTPLDTPPLEITEVEIAALKYTPVATAR